MRMHRKISLFARLARAREMGIVVILALVVVVVSIRNPAFLSGDNLYDIALDSAILAIVAVGAMMVILTGGIDISVGSGMALSGMVVALIIMNHWGIPPLAAVLMGTVVGWESGIVPGSRHVSTEPVSARKIGADQVQIIAERIGHKGQIAILSAAATMDNQNTWIKYMKEELGKPAYKEMELVAVVYGDDLREKSYNEALGLLKSYPKLRGIISPTSVGLAATARAVTVKKLIDKIEVTGLGLPSELAEYVKNGACKEFGLWNPIDLGYLNAYVVHRLATKEISGKPGEKFDAGRLGQYEIEPQEGAEYGLVYLGSLFRFNKDNIDAFKDVF